MAIRRNQSSHLELDDLGAVDHLSKRVDRLVGRAEDVVGDLSRSGSELERDEQDGNLPNRTIKQRQSLKGDPRHSEVIRRTQRHSAHHHKQSSERDRADVDEDEEGDAAREGGKAGDHDGHDRHHL